MMHERCAQRVDPMKICCLTTGFAACLSLALFTVRMGSAGALSSPGQSGSDLDVRFGGAAAFITSPDGAADPPFDA
jgi:hypothetical protein